MNRLVSTQRLTQRPGEGYGRGTESSRNRVRALHEAVTEYMRRLSVRVCLSIQHGPPSERAARGTIRALHAVPRPVSSPPHHPKG